MSRNLSRYFSLTRLHKKAMDREMPRIITRIIKGYDLSVSRNPDGVDDLWRSNNMGLRKGVRDDEEELEGKVAAGKRNVCNFRVSRFTRLGPRGN